LLALRKFTRFAALEPQSAEAREFVALEDWLNDGVPLALPVARECLGRWYGANEPGSGTWLVAGAPIEPVRFDKPALVVVPARDRIVPPASARALANALPRVSRLDPPLGHIGMIVGRRAEREVWQPLARWLLDGSRAKA
jgi:polyhydroxyalkanoate synthase